MQPKVGTVIPALPAPIRSKFPDTTGHWTVLYFYPQGNNPHCVMQSRRFQGLYPEFDKLGVQVVGVSVDTEEEQKTFREICSVTFPLISDTKFAISQAYGLLKTVTHEGKEKHYASRETFLIDPSNRVAMHWTDVDPNTHAREVLDQVNEVLGFPI